MYFEEFELGYQTKIDPVTIHKTDMVEFAEKYDSIRLHTDEEYA